MGRIFVLRLEHGDRLPDVIEIFATDNKILRGMCILVGGIDDGSRIVSGPENGKEIPPRPVLKDILGVHEVLGVGTIFPDAKGHPRLHMHASLGRKEKSRTGCIRPGVNIWQIGEVVILEIRNERLFRKKNKTLGFELLEIEE